MGYELHIIRKTNWEDHEEESVITLDEWFQYVEQDEELERTDFMEKRLSDESVIRHDTIGFVIWNGYKGSTYDAVWFDYNNGTVYTKNPDDEIVAKLIDMAHALNGKVQGD